MWKRKKHGGPAALSRMLKILLALASRHYGMTMREMEEEANVQWRTVARYIKTLEDCGVEIVRHREIGRYRWMYLYRLKTINGVKLDLTRRVGS